MTIKINPSSANVKVNPASASYKAYRCFQPYGWSHYVDLTIDHTQVTADVSDHTILIQDTAALAGMPADFWTTVQADGGDIVVTDARSGRHLHQELEYINTAGGSEALAIHARMPTLSSSRDDVLRIYYGNASASMPVEEAAWASHWEFVSHMADYNGGTQIKDSTANANHGTKGAGAAAPTEVAGAVGKAQQFDGAGTYIRNTSFSVNFGTADPFTIVAFLTRESGGFNEQHFTEFSNTQFYLYGSESNLRYKETGAVLSVSSLVENSPHCVAVVRDGAARTLYGDGGALGTGTEASPKDPSTTLTIGQIYTLSGNYWFKGPISEVRVSSSALSADENKLIYLEYLAPATLYGFGSHTAV